MKGGFLVYKCRRCGKLNKNLHVPNAMMALSLLVTESRFPIEWGGFAPGMNDMCNCQDGGFGVTDLIGAEEDK